MSSNKPITVEKAAAEINAALAPVVTFNGFDNLKQPVPPKVTQMPEPLKRACGIDQK